MATEKHSPAAAAGNPTSATGKTGQPLDVERVWLDIAGYMEREMKRSPELLSKVRGICASDPALEARRVEYLAVLDDIERDALAMRAEANHG
jgi:hypothetical protein